VNGHESLDHLRKYWGFEDSTSLPVFTYWRKLLSAGSSVKPEWRRMIAEQPELMAG
jgi:hypothetical protein